MADASQLIVHYDPPRKGTDGRITVERVGSADRLHWFLTEKGLGDARDYIKKAREKKFKVDDFVMDKAARDLAKLVAKARAK